MSVSEPEIPKPDNAVGQELPSDLGNLKAENKSLRQELEEARSQLATVAADRDEIDPINLTNKLNALLGKGRPPKMQLSVKEVRKALREVAPKQNPDAMPGEST